MTLPGNAVEAGRALRPAFVMVWDLFVRLFHWSLVTLFVIAWATAEGWRAAHEYAGYAIAVLIGLRLVWGVVGSRYARFADFIYRPSTVVRYVGDIVRNRARRYLGHNPAGGAMVVVMLLSLIATIATGIALTTGSTFDHRWVRGLHELATNLTILLAILHVAGVVLASLQHRENLIRSMITGLKRADPE